MMEVAQVGLIQAGISAIGEALPKLTGEAWRGASTDGTTWATVIREGKVSVWHSRPGRGWELVSNVYNTAQALAWWAMAERTRDAYPCGCPRTKVFAGRCASYGADGTPSTAPGVCSQKPVPKPPVIP